MKKILYLIIILLAIFCLWQKELVTKFIAQKIIYKNEIIMKDANEYYKNSNFLLVQNTNDFTVTNKDQFLNIIYTGLNYGWDEFTFFCDYTYKDCNDDFYNLIENTPYIQVINNYVHPFNSFITINFNMDTLGRIEIKLEKAYTEEQISKVNNTINKFIKENIDAKMNDKQKIKLFHDYIIDKTIYDDNFQLDSDKSKYPYHPYNAYGPLIENLGICSGYSDAMAIFLDKIGVKNYKISTDEHIWNLVYLDSNWYHLDLTWDDPVTNNGQQVILYDFYLISNEELLKKDTNQHKYKKDFYLEIK